MQINDYRFVYHKVGGHEAKFEASDQDTTSDTIQYFGFLHSDGAWIIQRFKITGAIIEYRYASGQDNYPASWTAKDTWAEGVWKYFHLITTL